jgi:hypothetical protein
MIDTEKGARYVRPLFPFLKQGFVEGRGGDFPDGFAILEVFLFRLPIMSHKTQELVARALKEMINHAIHRGIPDIGKPNGGFVIVCTGLERTMQKPFEEKTMHDRHDGGIGQLAFRMNCDLNVFDRDGIALPHRLHDVEFQRRQYERIIPIPSLSFGLQVVRSSPLRLLYRGHVQE